MSDNPQIRDDYSPLQTLIAQALVRHGEHSPSTIQGDVQLMFIDFANSILEEVRNHPYAEGTSLATVEDYISADDARPVPDEIIKTGLIFYYMLQQGDERAPIQQSFYTRAMNQRLWRLLNGNSKIHLRQVDGGTNRSNAEPLSTINGLPEA